MGTDKKGFSLFFSLSKTLLTKLISRLLA